MTQPVPVSRRPWFACLIVGAVLAVTCTAIVVLFDVIDSDVLEGAGNVFSLIGLLGGGALVVIGLLWALLGAVTGRKA